MSEAIKTDREIDKIFALSDGDSRLNYIVRSAEAKKIVVIRVDRKKLDAMSKTGAHQGIIAQCAATEYVGINDILDFRSSNPHIINIIRYINEHIT